MFDVILEHRKSHIKNQITQIFYKHKIHIKKLQNCLSDCFLEGWQYD